MNRNMVIVLAGGFLIAALVAVLVQVSLGTKKKGTAATAMTHIIVASRDLAPGTELKDEDMHWQEWPDTPSSRIPGMVIGDAKKKPSEVLSGRLLYPVTKDAPISKNNLVKEGTGNFVAAELGDGMRAIAINVDSSRMVAGFVGPGDYVDVLLTYRESVRVANNKDPDVDEMAKLNVRQLATETILQNIRVLAVDQSPKRDTGKKDEGHVGKTVTLEVTPRQSEILAMSSAAGTLSLALRKLGDQTIIDTKEPVVTDERVTHIAREIYAKAHEMSGQNNNVVRFYNGYNVVDQTTASP